MAAFFVGVNELLSVNDQPEAPKLEAES